MIISRQAGHRWLQLTFLLWLRALTAVSALKTNFTVEDDDPSIVYLPESAWTQIQWSGAFRDSPMAGDGSARMAHTGSDPTIENWWKIRMDSLQRESSTSIAEYGSATSSKRHPPISLTQRENAADPLSSPLQEISLSVSFAGSAIYLYGLTPLPPSSKFELDGQTHSYHPPSTDATFQPNDPVFSITSLNEGPHTLKLSLGLDADSAFLFDYLVYTRDVVWRNQQPRAPQDATQTSGESISSSSQTEPTPSASETPSKKRNVATFGAAVGGSVGLLALFSAGLALSIIRRRYKAKKRERLDRENGTIHPVLPGTAREMSQAGRSSGSGSDGSFVPRFFPGTEVPPRDPPGYNDVVRANGLHSVPPSMGQNHHLPYVSVPTHPYIHQEPARAPTPEVDLSYADIPPSESPPPGVETTLLPTGLTDSVPPSPALGRPPVRGERAPAQRDRSTVSDDGDSDHGVDDLSSTSLSRARSERAQLNASPIPLTRLGGYVGPGSHPGVTPEPSPHGAAQTFGPSAAHGRCTSLLSKTSQERALMGS